MSEEAGVYKVKEKDMDQEIQKAFNNSIGAVLTYLDEAEVGFAIKKAVKSELWELCDKKIMPIIGKGLGHGQEDSGNR
jgi:hypothetical protein